MRALLTGLAALLLAHAEAGNVVYTFTNVHPRHAKMLVEAECKSCGTDDGRVDVWHPDGLCHESIHDSKNVSVLEIRGGDELVSLAKELGIDVAIKVPDLAHLLSQERRSNGSTSADQWHTEYHTFGEIANRLQLYAQQYGATFLSSIGTSYQGTPIPGIRFGISPRNDIVYLQCGIHAREWISPAACMYVIEQLLIDYQSRTEPVYSYLQTVQVLVVPVVNPDGYAFTWSGNRMWRKNRRLNSDGSFGVDLNRNWDDHWGLCGSSNVPSSDTYRGTAPFSEPETASVQLMFQSMKNLGFRIQSGIDVHSYGQLILRPYGWILPTATCPGATAPPCVPPNENILAALGAEMRDTIFLNGARRYTSEHAAELYCAAGGADDWIASNTEQASGFCFELRDTGLYGFLLPAAQIIPTGNEIYHAYRVYLDAVIRDIQ